MRTTIVVGALAVLAMGCKPRLSAHLETKDDGVIVVYAYSDYDADVTCKGKKAESSDRFVFAAHDFPAGKQTITCTADKKGRKRTVDLTFDRKPMEPEAKIAPKESSGAYTPCAGDLCGEDTKLKIDDDGKLELFVIAQVGTEVDIDGESATVELDEDDARAATTPLTLDLTKHAPEISLAAFAKDASVKGGYLKLPVKIVADDTKKTTLQIAPSGLAPLLRAALGGIDKGPVTFDGDQPAGKTASSLLYLGDGSFRFFGADTTLRGLDLVAVGVKAKERSAGSCGSFVGTTGTTTVVKTAIDQDVTVYDRRTGKVKTKRHFTAPYEECPSTVMSSGAGDDTQTVTSTVDDETITKWLATLLPKK